MPETKNHLEAQVNERRKYNVAETLDFLLNADGLIAAIDCYRNRFEDKLLTLIRQNNAAVLKDGNVELADGLSNLVDVNKNLE